MSIILPGEAKSTFGVHERYIYQLRVNLSLLRSDKKSHHFIDIPSEIGRCSLGVVDIPHFLFECPFYATRRAALAVSVIEIIQRNNLNHLGNHSKLYLYGHPSFT